jgi:hypothetical protein
VLACTTPADLEEVVNTEPLRDFLVDHAGVIYQHANSLWQLADEDCLYLVSGCIKSDSWALAAYKHLAPPPNDLLTLSRREMDVGDPHQVPIYDWIKRGTAEARFGSNSAARESGAYKGKDQCLFLQGFKLALSPKFRARLKGIRLPVGDGQHQDASRGVSRNSSACEGTAGSGSLGGIQFGLVGSGLSAEDMKRSDAASQSAEVHVASFPDLSGASVRPYLHLTYTSFLTFDGTSPALPSLR